MAGNRGDLENECVYLETEQFVGDEFIYLNSYYDFNLLLLFWLLPKPCLFAWVLIIILFFKLYY